MKMKMKKILALINKNLFLLISAYGITINKIHSKLLINKKKSRSDRFFFIY